MHSNLNSCTRRREALKPLGRETSGIQSALLKIFEIKLSLFVKYQFENGKPSRPDCKSGQGKNSNNKSEPRVEAATNLVEVKRTTLT